MSFRFCSRVRSGRIISCLCSAMAMSSFATSAFAQNVNVNPGAGSYATLKDAFDAINAGTHTGAITVDIVGDTTEAASAVLNASGVGSSSYTSIVISPSGGASRTISGAIAGHMIDLNGADNVTIDGLNSGGNALTIDNTSATAATSSIRMVADAQNDTVTNCTIKGAGTSATAGTVMFDTGAATGNTGNSISNNTITNSGANFPVNGIYSLGTSAAIFNSGTISGNNIQDYFSATVISNGINLGATGNSAWTISNNRLFQTATRVYTTGNTHNAIFVGTGAGYTINGNIVGFANAGGTGTSNMIGNSVTLAGFPASYATAGTSTLTGFRGINAAFTAGGAVSNIQGNTVAGLALYTSANGSAIIGILVNSGNVNATGNTIGATTGGGGGGVSPASIYCATTGTGGAVVGILVASTNSGNIQNNTMGSIDSSGTSATIAGTFVGISTSGAAGVFSVTNNTVGNSTVDNIRIGYMTTTGVSGGPLTNNGILTQTTTATTGVINGVVNSATGATVNLNSNTLRNLASSVTNSSATTAFVGVANTGAVTATVNLNSNLLGTNSERLVKWYFGTTVGTMLGLFNSGGAATTTVNINNNIVQGMVTAATGQITTISHQAAATGVAINIKDNQIGTTAQDAITYTAASAGAFVGYFNSNGAATALLTITGNDIRRINQSTAAGTNAHIYIQNQTYTGSTNISNNTFTNITAQTSGSITFIGNSVTHAANSTHNVNNNSIATAYSKPTAAGTVLFYNSFSFSPITVTEINTGNNFSNMTFAGGVTLTGWRSADGTPGSHKTVTGNTFSNIVNGGTAATQILQVDFSDAAFTGNNCSGNTISTVSGGGAVTGILVSSTSQNVFNNTISGLSSNGASAAVIGISITGGTTQNVNNNTITGLSGSGATSPVVSGISVSGGTTVNVFKNKICDVSESGAISATSPAVNGLLLSGGTTVTAYDNLIGDLRTPAASLTDAIRGISVTSSTATTSYNVYYNTVYLTASSSGTNFGTTGVFHAASTTATTATLTLRNNAIVNNSTPAGTGATVAYRRSSGILNTLANYGGSSNNNDFYAGTPGVANLIYSDGTSSAQTIAAYQGGVFTAGTIAPRDSLSFTENPTFLSTTCGNANFLHINTAVPTLLESDAVNIAGITDDVDNDIRQGNAGYGGTGTAPDVGADEFNGIAANGCSGTPNAGSIVGANAVCSGLGTTLSLSGQSTGAGIQYQWRSGITPGGPYPNTLGTSSSQATGPLTVTTYFVCDVTCVNSSQTVTTAEKTVVVNPNPTVSVSPPSGLICNPGGAGVVLTASGASTYVWSPAAGLNTTTGPVVTATPTSSTIYTVTGTDANGCIGTANVAITVENKPAVTASATPPTVCPNGSSQLLAVASNAVGLNYNMTPLTGQTYTTLSGGGITTITTDAQLTPGFSTGNQDDGGVVVTLPFTFTYLGNNFTQMCFCTNGWISAGNGNAAIAPLDSRTAGNLFNTTAPNNTIAAWFKDMGANYGVGFPGSMRHGLIGTEVYAFQWDQAVGSSFSNTTTILISFQINIYGQGSSAPGRIEMIYGPTLGSIAFTASEGIEDGTGGTNHYLNALTGNGTATTTSTVWPGNGNGWRFDPAVFSYSWSPATFLNNPNIANPLASGVTNTTVYTVTATAASGCNNTAQATVTVGDTTPPQIQNCPADIPVNNDPGLCSAVVSWTPPTATDNCTVASFTPDHNPGDTFPVGNTLVTYTATDGFNNTTSCTFHVIVSDVENPTVVGCPLDIPQNTDPGQPFATVTWTAPTPADNCPGSTITSNHNPGDQFLCGSTAVTYIAHDTHGHDSSPCSFNVIVTDAEFPSFNGTCPSTIMADADPGVCTHTVTWTAPTATDNKGTPVVVQTLGPPSGSAFTVGTTHIQYSATDPQNNVSFCNFDVIITDTQNPTLTPCPGNITVNTDPGQCFATVTWMPPTAGDNCPGVQLTSNHNPGDHFTVGDTLVTYTATDASNHTTQCSFHVFVTDIIPAGTDCWTTECGSTSYDFRNTPIPAGFFDPGSEPFDGLVFLGGGDPGDIDTRVQRLAPINFPATLPSTQNVPIEIVSLNLVSCQPITVRYCNGAPNQTWNLSVDLSPAPTPPPGVMQVTKTHCNGGYFTSQFQVQPRFIFKRISDNATRVLDTGAALIPPMTLQSSSPAPWVHNATIPIGPTICGTNFVPGVQEAGQSVPGSTCVSATMCSKEVCHQGPGHQHCTGHQSVPCPCGACCNNTTGACSEFASANPAADCATSGGTYKGDGKACAPGLCTPPCLTIRGDLNGDYKLDGIDIGLFSHCLIDHAGPEYPPPCACADVNGDHLLTTGDIPGFVTVILNGGNCP